MARQSAARGKIHQMGSHSALSGWIIANAHWYFDELASLSRPPWTRIARMIAEDGVALRNGTPLTPDAVRNVTKYWQARPLPAASTPKASPLPRLVEAPTSTPSTASTPSLDASAIISAQRARIRGDGVR